MLPDKKIFKDFMNQFLILAPGDGCYNYWGRRNVKVER